MADRNEWNERYASKPLVWSSGPNQLFADEVSNLTPGRAVDLACGEGRNAIWLAEQGWQVTAIDFSEEGIRKGREIAAKREVSIEWIVADLSTYKLEPSSFDLVAVVFLHTGPAEREKWLPMAIEAVAPGGTFVYIGHDPRNIEEGVGGPQDPLVLPDADTIAANLGSFDVSKATVFERSVGSDPGHGGSASGTALDTLVVAHRPG